MQRIRDYMRGIKEYKREMEEEKARGIACLNTKMTEIRLVREL